MAIVGRTFNVRWYSSWVGERSERDNSELMSRLTSWWQVLGEVSSSSSWWYTPGSTDSDTLGTTASPTPRKPSYGLGLCPWAENELIRALFVNFKRSLAVSAHRRFGLASNLNHDMKERWNHLHREMAELARCRRMTRTPASPTHSANVSISVIPGTTLHSSSGGRRRLRRMTEKRNIGSE